MKKIYNYPISRRERKKRESKARILKVARRYFQNKGFENTLIEEIADGADISKSTFFNYFSSKENLLKEIANEEIDKIREYVELELDKKFPAKDKIYLVMKFLLEDITPYNRLAKKIMQAISLVSNEKNTYITRLQNILIELVEEGQVKGELKIDISAYSLAAVIVGAYYWAFLKWISYNVKFTDDQKVEFVGLLDVIFTGLVVEK